MPATMKSKARSAVSGRYVDSEAAKKNPRETVIERARRMGLSRNDLKRLRAVFGEYGLYGCGDNERQYHRILKALGAV